MDYWNTNWIEGKQLPSPQNINTFFYVILFESFIALV